MKIIHIEIITEDQFDFSKNKRVLTRSIQTFEKLKSYVGKYVQKGDQVIKILEVKKHVCKDQICNCK